MTDVTHRDPQTQATAVKPSPESQALPTTFGRYRVLERLGKGAFGSVFKAIDEELLRLVAVKVPHFSGQATAREVDEFKSEARIVASLKHANIVPIFDFGGTPDGACFLVYEYISGTDLAKRMASGRLTWQEAVVIVSSIAEALAHAHKHDIVHRDVKPSNIMLNEQGRALLADFGLAVRDADRRTKPSELAGTPPYMSPEQVRGDSHRLDGRTDIWSLGVVLYELLAGRKPFQGKELPQLFDEIEHQEAKPLRMIDDTIGADLERICLRALSKGVSGRYTTAKDMADDLRRVLNPREVSVSRDREATEIMTRPAALAKLPRPLAPAGAEELPASPTRVSKQPGPSAERGPTTGELVGQMEMSAFHPSALAPLEWNSLAIYVHGAPLDRMESPSNDAAQLIMESQASAPSRTGEDQFGASAAAGVLPSPEEVTLVPFVPGMGFKPLRRTLPLDSSLQWRTFRMCVLTEKVPERLTGSISVFVGGILIGAMPLTIKIDRELGAAASWELSTEMLQRFRRVFVSLDPADEAIRDHVDFLSQRLQFPAISHRTRQLVSDREAPEITRAIEEAEVFEVLWSTTSMQSSIAATDYSYALSLRRPGFVRPVYWSDVAAAGNTLTPPAAMSRICFESIGREREAKDSPYEVVVLSLQTGYQLRIRLPQDRIVRFGREPHEGWAMPWEPKMSREHGYFWLDDGMLKVCCRDSLNAVYYRGKSVREFVMSDGTDFRIGNTIFVFSRQTAPAARPVQLQRPTVSEFPA